MNQGIISIPVRQLKVGMKVVKLDIPWRRSPFSRQGFIITGESELILLRKYCRKVEVELAAESEPADASSTDTLTVYSDIQDSGRSTTNLNIHHDAEDTTGLSGKREPPDVQCPETVQADRSEQTLQVFTSAIRDLEALFSEVQAGGLPDSIRLKRTVAALAQEVMQDDSGLILLARLQQKSDTLAHKSVRVCILTLVFAKHLSIRKDQLYELGLAALLHDIGMLNVPDNLLNYPGELNPSQRNIVEQHVEQGVALIMKHPILSGYRHLADMVALHHERYDGSGYPNGLKGKEIPLFARILGLTTTYEAMTRQRFFSPKTSPTHALAKLYRWRYKLFDGRLVEKFIQALGVYPPGCVVELSSGHTAIVTEINKDKRTRPIVRLLTDRTGAVLAEQPEFNLANEQAGKIYISKILDTRDLDQAFK